MREAWTRQIATLTLAPGDALTDNGQEVWNLLAQRHIDHVMLCGVHLNMCVLGRPFAIRQMVYEGKTVALMRDMTDTMYNPARWPYVTHFTGTDLIVGHIEKFVCPTITSDQILGGEPFRFTGDKRPHSAIPSDVPIASRRSDYQRHWELVPVPGSLADRFRV